MGIQYGTWRQGSGTWPPDLPYDPKNPYSGWKYITHPLLGEYSSSDPYVIAKHLDWLGGHGVTFVLSFIDGPLTYDTTKLSLLANPLSADTKVAVCYDLTSMLPNVNAQVIDFTDNRNLTRLSQDFDQMAVDYFSHPNYFRINNRPFVFLFGEWDMKGSVLGTISTLRQQLREKHGIDVYLVGSTAEFRRPLWKESVGPYDAVSKWSAYDESPEICCSDFESNLDELYRSWSGFAEQNSVQFIPTVTPGFQATRPAQLKWPVLVKSPDRFRRQIRIAKQYTDKSTPIMLISTFNDLAENTTVEPSVEEGFQYLQVLKEELSA